MVIGPVDKYIVRIMLQNKIYKCSGQSYEDLFCQIAKHVNPNFELVKAHGSSGDKKNDGFDKTNGTFYQVFAPDDIAKYGTIKEGAKKLRTDFDGLFAFWNKLCPIKHYYFVINDKYKGVPPEIHTVLLELSSEYTEISFDFYLAKNLEDDFLSLSQDDIISIIGLPPDPTLQLDYSALSSVIEHLMNSVPEETNDLRFLVPDFEEKIRFNNLSDKVATQMRAASYQVGSLERFFYQNSEYTRADIQRRIVASYHTCAAAVDHSLPNYSDLVFLGIIDDIYPNGSMAIKNAIIILMAYYFESCDIFEPPEKGDV